MHTHVIGLFEDERNISDAVDALTSDESADLGVRDVTILTDEEMASVKRGVDTREEPRLERTKADQGVGLGAFIGGVAGALFGISTVSMTWSALDLGFGSVAQTLLFTGLGIFVGVVLGGLLGAAKPEQDQELYMYGAERDEHVVTVSAPDDFSAKRAITLMREHGAQAVQRDDASWQRAVRKIIDDVSNEDVEQSPTEQDMSNLTTPYTTIETPDEAREKRKEQGNESQAEWAA